MIAAMKRIILKINDNNRVDIVLIGHSKSFLRYNEKTLDKFLKFAVKQKSIMFTKFE